MDSVITPLHINIADGHPYKGKDGLKKHWQNNFLLAKSDTEGSDMLCDAPVLSRHYPGLPASQRFMVHPDQPPPPNRISVHRTRIAKKLLEDQAFIFFLRFGSNRAIRRPASTTVMATSFPFLLVILLSEWQKVDLHVLATGGGGWSQFLTAKNVVFFTYSCSKYRYP